MATKPGLIAVSGLRELRHDLDAFAKGLSDDVVMELEEVAGPVRMRAEAIVSAAPKTGMRNINRGRGGGADTSWSEMRAGVSKREALVYVVPAWSGRGMRRGRTQKQREQFREAVQPRMDKALVENVDKIVNRLDDLLGRLGNEHGFY